MHIYIVFLKKLRPASLCLTWELFKVFITSNRTDISLFKQVKSKYRKRIVLIFLYTLYKAQRKSESSFSHSFLAVSSLLVMQQICSFIY